MAWLPSPCLAATAQRALSPPRSLSLLVTPGNLNTGAPDDPGQFLSAANQGWTHWWTFNRDPFLAELRKPGSGLAAATPLGGARATGAAPGLDAALVHLEVVPLLQQRLAQTKDNDLAVGCLMALGKIGEAPRELVRGEDITTVEASISARLTDSNEIVRDTAVLALGLVGGPRVAALLISIIEESDDGKKALGVGRVDRGTKAAALYALGLVGHRSRRPSERTLVVSHLLRALEAQPDEGELGVAAALGLAWAPLKLEASATPTDAPPKGQEDTIRRLLAVYEGGKANAVVRAHVPVAIARLVQTKSGLEDPANALPRAALHERLRLEVISAFNAGLAIRGGEKNSMVREGLAQALGLLVEPRRDGPDRDAIERLVDGSDTANTWEGGLSRVALARVAARAGIDKKSTRGEIATEIIEGLRLDCTEGKNADRAWSALALGLYEHAIHRAGGASSLETLNAIQAQLLKGASPTGAAAAAIAMGLAGDQEHKSEIEGRLDSGDFMVRGIMATSLALMGARDKQVRLRNLIAERLVHPTVLQASSVALALLHDEGLVELLVSKIARSRFMEDRIAALQGLAWSYDVTAVPALLYVVREKRVGTRVIDDKSRAFAAAALGAICAGSPLPWNTHLALDLTWSAAPPSLTDRRLGGGVLDLF